MPSLNSRYLHSCCTPTPRRGCAFITRKEMLDPGSAAPRRAHQDPAPPDAQPQLPLPTFVLHTHPAPGLCLHHSQRDARPRLVGELNALWLQSPGDRHGSRSACGLGRCHRYATQLGLRPAQADRGWAGRSASLTRYGCNPRVTDTVVGQPVDWDDVIDTQRSQAACRGRGCPSTCPTQDRRREAGLIVAARKGTRGVVRQPGYGSWDFRVRRRVAAEAARAPAQPRTADERLDSSLRPEKERVGNAGIGGTGGTGGVGGAGGAGAAAAAGSSATGAGADNPTGIGGAVGSVGNAGIGGTGGTGGVGGAGGAGAAAAAGSSATGGCGSQAGHSRTVPGNPNAPMWERRSAGPDFARTPDGTDSPGGGPE